MTPTVPVRDWRGRRLSFGGSRQFWRISGASQRTMTFKKAGSYARVSLKLIRETGPRAGRTAGLVFKSSSVLDIEIADGYNAFLIARKNQRSIRICIFVAQPDREDGIVYLAA